MFWFIIKALPKRFISSCVGCFCQLKLPFFSKWISLLFYNKYKIDLSISEKNNIQDYANVTELFTRKLKQGARPVDRSSFWVHPADARLFSFGTLKQDQIFQVKSLFYDLKSFLALDYLKKDIKKIYNFEATFKNAQHFDYYLCPTDYHRVHSPVEGKIVAYCYIPGAYWPVNALSRSKVEGLFSKNERLVFYIKTEQGLVSLTMVGALCVGKIYNSIASSFARKKSLGASSKPVFVDNVNHLISQGDELGIFYMGSTVICLLEKSINFTPAFVEGQKTEMGRSF